MPDIESSNSTPEPTSVRRPRPKGWPPNMPWPLPGFPGPTVPEPDIRQFAMAMGDMHGALFSEEIRQFEEAGKDRSRAMKGKLERLQEFDLLTPTEVQRLGEVVDLVIVADRKGSNSDQEIAMLQRIFKSLSDQEASPVAIGLVAIAVDSASRQGRIARSDLDGAIEGGITGAATGKKYGGNKGALGGAVVGGLLGGAWSSFAAWVDQQPQQP